MVKIYVHPADHVIKGILRVLESEKMTALHCATGIKKRYTQTALFLLVGSVSLVVIYEMTLLEDIQNLGSRTGNPQPLPAHYSNDTDGCLEEPLRIVVLVMTRPVSVKRRKTIRDTWSQTYNSTQVNLTLKFIIGMGSVRTSLAESLLNERKQYGDLLLMDELYDSYSNLPFKVMMGLRWASDNLEFDYLVKVDDDMYLRLEMLSQALRQMNCEAMLYWGNFMAGTPDQRGRNLERNWLHCTHYFPYATGGGYVLAEKVIKSAMPFSESVEHYNNEDVTVGAMLAPYNINKVHDSRFITHGNRCSNDFIVLNVHQDERFYEILSRLQNEHFCEWTFF